MENKNVLVKTIRKVVNQTFYLTVSEKYVKHILFINLNKYNKIMEKNSSKKITKKDLKDKCKSILNSIEIKAEVSNKADFDFLMERFRNHPEWKKKQGNQKIVAIKIGIDESHKTRCFQLFREDGSFTDISYFASIDGVSITKNVKNACRTVERPRIEEFKNSSKFPLTYKYNGVTSTINNPSEMEVDHYEMDFDQLVNKWVEQNGGYKELNKHINATEDKSTVTRFTDTKLVDSFAKFARENSKLRPLTKADHNSRRLGKKRNK